LFRITIKSKYSFKLKIVVNPTIAIMDATSQKAITFTALNIKTKIKKFKKLIWGKRSLPVMKV